MFKTKALILAVALMLLALPISQAAGWEPPTGKLSIPDHHAGVLGDNPIPVTAYELQEGVQYRITMRVSYHENPRTPPEPGAVGPASYRESVEFVADATGEYQYTFKVPLPDCHWQITAGFTLYYTLDGGETWGWNGNATPAVDIWSDCEPPPEEPGDPGTGTPGYWKNHPDAWPTNSIEIGGTTYSKEMAIEYIKKPVKKDKTFTMFQALVAAKLNVMIGNDDSCVAGTIAAADAWMADNPIGSEVKGNSDAWKAGEPLYWTLDDYNNGLLCAPARD